MEWFDYSVFDFSAPNQRALVPYLVLSAGIAFTLVAASFNVAEKLLRYLTAGFLLASATAFLTVGFYDDPTLVLGTSLQVDSSLRLVGAGVCMLAFVASWYIKGPRFRNHSEWGVLLLIAVTGLCLLPGTRNWPSMFIALETFSISAYLLCSLDSRKERSLEASMKYLMMGAFVSAFLLLGIALLFGISGSMSFEEMAVMLSDPNSGEGLVVLFASALIMGALFFKVSIFPFHMWAADVYQGAPTGVASFLAGATKLSVFCFLLSAYSVAGFDSVPGMSELCFVFGAASVLFGSLMAIAQRRVRRMLAYSGVVNAGYALLVLPYSSFLGMFSFIFFYAVAVAIAFALIEAMNLRIGKDENGDLDMSQLFEAKGTLPKICFVLFPLAMFSLAGIPPFPGFFGKYLLIADAAGGEAYWSLGLILFGTLLGLAYYLRVLVPMFFHDALPKPEGKSVSVGLQLQAATIAVFLSVVMIKLLADGQGILRTAEAFAR